jgi:hypothetical protein
MTFVIFMLVSSFDAEMGIWNLYVDISGYV